MVWLGGQRIGRNQWIDPSKSAQSMKIFVPRGNGHQGLQRLASVEGDFTNQVAGVACFVDIGQFSFSAKLSLSQRLRNKAAMSEGTEVVYGLSILYFHSPRQVISSHCRGLNLSTAEISTES